jgi:RNA polymerase sigma factor (sigma-70 family)
VATGGSVTTWIGQLETGEEVALAKLHARYWPALVQLARKRLKGIPGRAADEEDVAQEAFWGFYRSLKAGRVPRLASRHDLLALLTHIIACTAVNHIEHEVGVQRRGGGRPLESLAVEQLATSEPPSRGPGRAAKPSPLEQAILKDCYQHYMDGLSEKLHDFAELYLTGITNREIADRLGCSERTVERKIALILQRWQEMAGTSVNQTMERG